MNTLYSKIYSISSRNDVKQVIGYLKHTLKSPSAANNLYNLVNSTVKKLQTFPYKHPKIDDPLLASYHIRYVTLKSYLLFYTVTEETKTIYIIRFLYSRRNWQHILQRTVQYDEYLSKNITCYVHEEQEEYGKQFKKEHNNMPETQNTNIDNENFDKEKARQELFNELQKGLDDIKASRTVPAEEVFAMLREELEK